MNADGGAETVRRIEAAGGTARFEHLDVADETSVTALATKAGPIRNLINCAGILQNANRVEDMDLAEHDRVWAVNYRGTYLCCRAWGGIIAEAGGGQHRQISAPSPANACSPYRPIPPAKWRSTA